MLKTVWGFVVAVIVFIRDTFSDGGNASASRVLTAVVIGAWVRVALKGHAIPDHTTDVAVLVLALYGVNSLGGNLKDAFAALKSGLTNQSQ